MSAESTIPLTENVSEKLDFLLLPQTGSAAPRAALVHAADCFWAKNVGVCTWRHQCSSFSEITKRKGYSWAQCQGVTVVSSHSQCGCQVQNMSNILIVFTSIKVSRGFLSPGDIWHVAWHCKVPPAHRHLSSNNRSKLLLSDFFNNPSDQLLSLLWRRWFYQRWQHFSQTFECGHTQAATVQQSCTSRANLGPDVALGWQRRESRTIVLPKCRVSAACARAPKCFSIIFWLSGFLYLPATGLALPSI